MNENVQTGRKSGSSAAKQSGDKQLNNKDMDIKNLTDEQKADLMKKLKEDERLAKEKREQDRETFKEIKDEAVRDMFEQLCDLSRRMVELKEIVFARFEDVIALKDEIYKTKSDRQSDTFTTEDAMISIKLGNRINEGWGDTVEVGVQKVKDFLKTLAKDDESSALVDTVMRLLAKDRKGNLRANKVLELEQMANKSKNESFIEGIQIIKDAYRPVPTCQFIEVRYKNDKGKEVSLPLSMSAIP